MLATKERIVADRQFATERYIRGTLPMLYVPLWKYDGSPFYAGDAGQGFVYTVTGALWTPQGRSFDGVGDYISFPAITLPSAGTWLGWLKWLRQASTYGAFQVFFPDTFYQHNGNDYIYLFGAGYHWSYIPPLGIWLNFAFTWANKTDNTTYSLYVNLDKKTLNTGAAGTPGDPIRLGGTTGKYWQGLMGEVSIYNRALTALEVQQNYLATKWRYQ